MTIEAKDSAPAFDGAQPAGPEGDLNQVRPAGPDAMRDRPGDWETTDEVGDESFPASDPPACNRFD